MKLIYPSEANAVGGAGLFQGKECKQLREYQFATLINEIKLSPLQSFKISGFGLTIGTGLVIHVAGGYGIVEGRHVENTAQEDFTVSNGVTNYIYETVGFTGGFANSLTITSNTTGVIPASSFCIGKAVAAGGVVTGVNNATAIPNISYGDVTDQQMFLGFTPKFIIVSSTDGSPMSFAISGHAIFVNVVGDPGSEHEINGSYTYLYITALGFYSVDYGSGTHYLAFA